MSKASMPDDVLASIKLSEATACAAKAYMALSRARNAKTSETVNAKTGGRVTTGLDRELLNARVALQRALDHLGKL